MVLENLKKQWLILSEVEIPEYKTMEERIKMYRKSLMLEWIYYVTSKNPL